jgi:hypothetical protein
MRLLISGGVIDPETLLMRANDKPITATAPPVLPRAAG